MPLPIYGIARFSPAVADVRVRLVQGVRGGIETEVRYPAEPS